MEAALEPFTAETGINVDVEVVDWGVQLDRIRNAAVSGEARTSRRRARRRCRSSPRSAASRTSPGASRTSAARAPTPRASGRRRRSSARTAPGRSRGSPRRARSTTARTLEQAGVDEATAFSDWDSFRSTLQAIDERGAGHRAVRHARQEGVRPRPPRDAVRVGRRRRRAVRGQHEVDDQLAGGGRGRSFFADLVNEGLADPSQLERDGTQVENQFKAGKIAVWMGGPWVLGSVERTDDENWVPAARKNVGPRRCRPAPRATRSRSSAART